jgi:hypothetical protein
LEFLKIVTAPIMTTYSRKHKRGETPQKKAKGCRIADKSGADAIERKGYGWVSGYGRRKATRKLGFLFPLTLVSISSCLPHPHFLPFHRRDCSPI